MNHTFEGDHGPLKVMHNGRQIAGAVKAQASGAGRVELGEGIYHGGLPSVVVHGEGKQDGTPTPDTPIAPVFLEGATILCLGKNLLNTIDRYPIGSKTESYGITLEALDRGKFHLKGRSTDRIYSQFYIIPYNYPLEVPFDRIKVSLNGKSNKSIWLVAGSGDFQYTEIICGNSAILKRVGAGNDFNYGILRIRKGIDIDEEISISIQPEDSSLLPYEPYYDGGTATLPILRALPDGSVRDEIDLASGTVTRRVFEAVYNGTENWLSYMYQGTRNGFYYSNHIYPYQKGMYSSTKLVSNMVVQGIGSHGPDNSAYFSAREINVILPSFSNDVDCFKKWLSEHNLIVWYPLETPIIEHYDPIIFRQHPGYTQLIQQGGFREAEIQAEYWKEMNL